MSNIQVPEGWLATDSPGVMFEDNHIGRMKKEIWEASDKEIDAVLAEYGMPAPVEWGKPGSYIQTTIRRQLIEERRTNDIVLIPIGCTENHGMHTVSAADTLFVSQICEGRATLHQGQRLSRRHLAAASQFRFTSLSPLRHGRHRACARGHLARDADRRHAGPVE